MEEQQGGGAQARDGQHCVKQDAATQPGEGVGFRVQGWGVQQDTATQPGVGYGLGFGVQGLVSRVRVRMCSRAPRHSLEGG